MFFGKGSNLSDVQLFFFWLQNPLAAGGDGDGNEDRGGFQRTVKGVPVMRLEWEKPFVVGHIQC